MARQFNSNNASTNTGYRIVYEDAIDVLTHLASLDGSNHPAKELLINHIPPRIAGDDWGTDDPEELQDMHGDQQIDGEGNAIDNDSGTIGPYDHDSDEDMTNLPDNLSQDPETDAALKEQESYDFLEQPEIVIDNDPDLSGEVETCQTCKGDSVHNEFGKEFYFQEHCPAQGQDCTCDDSVHSPNSSPHCRGCKNPAKCPGKEKFEWQLVDEHGSKITDICPDCANTGVVPIGHLYGEEFQSHEKNDENNDENIESKPKDLQPEYVTESPESTVNPTPGVNVFEDERSETTPKAKSPAKVPAQTGADTSVPLGSFDKALKLREQLRQAEEQRKLTTPKSKEEVTHNNCGCASRKGDLTDEQFRTVMQSDEGKQAIDQIKRKYSNEGATEEERQSTGMTDTQLMQQAIGDKMVELKRCPGDEALSKIGENVK
jgi:hypothetical protein